MGLDMYLYKKTYVKNWDHNPEDRKTSVSVKLGGKKHPSVNPKKVTNIEEEVGYWRKANQIHQWFVSNVQGGEDNCQESYVDVENMKTLLQTCLAIKNETKVKDGMITNPEFAEELLPTQGGFFFGGEEYDDCYMEEINDTIKILETELLKVEELSKLPTPIISDYYYRASW